MDAKGCIIDETKRTDRRHHKKNGNGSGGIRTKATQHEYLQKLEKGNAFIHSDERSVITSSNSNGGSVSVGQQEEVMNIVDDAVNNDTATIGTTENVRNIC